MRQRGRKKVIDRQSLFNIHLACFTAELNRAVEEAYGALDELICRRGISPSPIPWPTA